MLNLTPESFEKIIKSELNRLSVIDNNNLKKIYQIKDPIKCQHALTEFLASGTNTDEVNKIFRMGSDLTGFWESLSENDLSETKLYESLHSKGVEKLTKKELKIYTPLKEKVKSLLLSYKKEFNNIESHRIFNNISQMYYQAKESGTNPQLVKEVEKAIQKQS